MRAGPLLCLVLAGALAVAGQPNRQHLLAELKSYDYSKPRATLRALELLVARARSTERQALADKLVVLFADPATPMPARRFIARQLPLLATSRHVPAIAKLLDDPKSAEMARRVLEAIPGQESLAALRAFLKKAKGRLLLGAINSLGVRRDAEAVAPIAHLLGSRDAAVVAASAEALGKIATPQAANALLAMVSSPRARPFVRDALLRCAHALAKENPTLAWNICQQLWDTAASSPERVAALATAAKVSPKRCVAILLSALGSHEPRVRAAALELAARTESPELTKALIARLQEARGDQKASLIRTLGHRGDKAALPAILPLLDAKDQGVRIAAIEALATLGDATTVEKLLSVAATETGATQAAARRTLALVKAAGAEDRLRGLARHPDPRIRAEAIQALAARGATAATPTFLGATTDPDAQVRQAAVEAVAQLGTDRDFQPLLSAWLAAKEPGDLPADQPGRILHGGRVELLPDAQHARVGHGCSLPWK